MRKQWRRNRVAFERRRRRGAGLPDDRQPVQRPRRHLDVRQPLPARSAQLPGAEPERWDPRLEPAIARAARQRADPRQPRPLPGRDRRAGPRHQRRGRAPGRARGRAQHCYEALRRSATRAAGRARAYPSAGLPATDEAPLTPARALQRGARRRSARRRSDCCAAGMRGSPRSPPRPTATRCAAARSPARTTADSLSQQQIPKIAPPRFDGWGDRLRFLMKENLPGSYPYTGGVFPYRREGEDPTRMFAGEGTPGAHQPPLPLPLARASRRRASRPRSTRSRCTARTRPSAPTSTARSATRASRSRRSTTPRSCTPASTCARRRPRCR